MEYRKKHLKPKANIDATLQRAFTNEEFMYRIDFIGSLRKNAFINQNEHKIKPVKACTITSDGMTLYLNQCLQQFVKNYEAKPNHRRHLVETYKRLDLGKDAKLKERVIQNLYDHYTTQQSKNQGLTSSPGAVDFEDFKFNAFEEINQELWEKAEIQCEQMTMNELKVLFNQRGKQLLQAVFRDRNKQQGSSRKLSPADLMMLSNMCKSRAQAIRTRKESNPFQIRQMLGSEAESHINGMQETSQDGKSIMRSKEGSNTNIPIIKTRQRADTAVTKESSNDDEMKCKTPVRSSCDEKTFASNASKLEKIQQKLAAGEKGPLAIVNRWQGRLEKIESMGSQELEMAKNSIAKMTNKLECIRGPSQSEMIFEEMSDATTTKHLQQSATQISQSQKSQGSFIGATTVDQDQPFSKTNFNISNSDFSEFQMSTTNNQHSHEMKLNLVKTKNAINKFELRNDLEGLRTPTTDRLVVEPELAKQMSQPFPQMMQLQTTNT